jgi:hypothetical protein
MLLLIHSTSSSEVFGLPGECPFTTLPISWNCQYHWWINLSGGTYFASTWRKYLWTVLIGLNSAHNNTHCDFSCGDVMNGSYSQFRACTSCQCCHLCAASRVFVLIGYREKVQCVVNLWWWVTVAIAADLWICWLVWTEVEYHDICRAVSSAQIELHWMTLKHDEFD